MASVSSKNIIEYKEELRKIIRDLEAAANGIEHDFKNVGNDKCAQSIWSVANKCKEVEKKLDSIDLYSFDEMIQKVTQMVTD